MHKEDLALINLQWLICHKTKPNKFGMTMDQSLDLDARILYGRPAVLI